MFVISVEFVVAVSSKKMLNEGHGIDRPSNHIRI